LTRALGGEHQETLANRMTLGDCLMRAGRHGESVEMTRSCLEVRVRVLGPAARDTMHTRDILCGRLNAAGRHAAALELLQEQKRLARAAPDAWPGAYAMASLKEGHALRDLGQLTRARECYLAAISSTPLSAPNQAERGRLQNIIRMAVDGLANLRLHRCRRCLSPRKRGRRAVSEG
jgi:tetratricopeptide (TPR) repeat protein